MPNEPNLDGVDGKELFDAISYLATVKALDPPNFVDLVRATIILKSSNDLEAVRLAAKAHIRNLERMEELLTDAQAEIERLEERLKHSL
jgi:hypothetical protein